MAGREQAQSKQGAGTWQAESRDKASIMKARGRQGESSPKGKHAEKIKKELSSKKQPF